MEKTTSIGHRPSAKWKFDRSVTTCFDDMLRRSIPQHDSMRDLVHSLAVEYARRGSWIVDLGCSRGVQLERLCQTLGVANRYCGVEMSKPMLKASRRHLRSWKKIRVARSRRDFGQGLGANEAHIRMDL